MASMSFRYPILGMASTDPYTSMGEYDELYQDYKSMRVRTRRQDIEIKALEDKLKEQEKKKEMDLKNLIAYYYNKNA